MKKIDLCFSGWIRGVEIANVMNEKGEILYTRNISTKDLIEGLNNGKFTISLAGCLNQGEDEEIEIFDFDSSKS